MGESAGVVCHIKDIEPLRLADDPDKAPELVSHGLELTNLVVIPHWDNPKYKAVMSKIREQYTNQGITTHLLRDGEVMFIDDNKIEII